MEAGDHRVVIGPYHDALLAWGRPNFRAFPWRLTTDPYRVLVAEIMLHRTQAAQIIPVYERFVSKYPEASALAEASLDELYEVLCSLGLRWRVELLHKMARVLADEYHGKVPEDRQSLIALPGVSDYIASAVRCFAWNMSEPLVDTNTVRVVGRLFGMAVRDSSRRNSDFRRLVSELLDRERPRAYNFAMLDLAHVICTKRRPPACLSCPVRPQCKYYLGAMQSDGMDPGG